MKLYTHAEQLRGKGLDQVLYRDTVLEGLKLDHVNKRDPWCVLW